MKLSSFNSLLLVGLVANASAASVDYSANFDNLSTGSVAPPTFPDQIAGQGGWTINDSAARLSFASTFAGTPAAALGGYYNGASATTVGLNQAYEATLSRTTATFDFGIIDSLNTFPGRDEFAFSWYSGSTNLFSVHFVPLDPTDTNPGGDTDAGWRLYYSSGGGPRTTLSIVVEEEGAYSFDLALSASGGSTVFKLGVSTIGLPDGPENPLIRNGSFAVNPNTQVDKFAFEWTPTGGGASGGSNYFVFDNVTAVPEPSAAQLFGFAGLAFVANRRRRA
jgi:hypothetical protein